MSVVVMLTGYAERAPSKLRPEPAPNRSAISSPARTARPGAVGRAGRVAPRAGEVARPGFGPVTTGGPALMMAARGPAPCELTAMTLPPVPATSRRPEAWYRKANPESQELAAAEGERTISVSLTPPRVVAVSLRSIPGRTDR